MLEMIGVLGVMAILASIVAVNVMNSVKLRRRDAEGNSMTAIASTLKLTILRTKYIPAQTNWGQAVANFMATPINKITRSEAGTTRVLLVDPALRLGTNASSVLPYTQGVSGTIAPTTNARVVLISSLMGELPTLNSETVTFSNVWNAPTDGVPAGTTWAGWAGRSKDLRILRMDLRNLFSRVILENLDSWRAAPYSVDTTNTLTFVPAGSRREIWLLNSTVLNFHFTDNSLQGREYLVEDVSYTYENGRWGRFLWNGPNRPNGWFGEMVDRFLAARRPDYDTRRFSSQMWTIEAMYVFLWNFGQWSIDNFNSGSPLPHVPAVELSGQGAGTLRSCSADLLSN
jgi:type II secretory pathway pseudopilin PulG